MRKLTQSAFLSFLNATGFLPPPLRDGGALIYRSLLYLSLFQLSPIQDAFRRNNTRSGHELDEGKLVIGQKGSGISIVLQQDLKKAIVFHGISGQHEPMYLATAWRGDWRVEIEVEDIEVWTEQQPECGNEDKEE